MTYTAEQMREYQNTRRAALRAELKAMLGGRCWCGRSEDLQFDHIDPTTKIFAIASGLDRPRAQLLAEVAKCQLLCRPHHIEKSRTDPLDPNRAQGSRIGSAKLTESDVLAIRASTESRKVLANLYGVSTYTISLIRTRKRWTHI